MENVNIKDVIPENELDRQLYFIEKCKEYVNNLSKELGRQLTCCTQTFG